MTAQDQALQRNYFFNNLYNLNPAAAGFDGPFISQITVSKKWLGINDSPVSQVLSNSLRLGEEDFYDPNMFLNRPLINVAKRVGVGLTVYNETSGPMHHTGMMLAYAYHIQVNESRLSFGISGLISHYRLHTEEFRPMDEADPAIYISESAWVPGVNAGVMFYNRNFFSGFAANDLLNLNNTLDHVNTCPEFILYGGYDIRITSEIKIQPSVFLNRLGNGVFSADINSKIFFGNQLWLLLSYQANRDVLCGISLDLKNDTRLLYSYALNITGLASYYQGSHNISLRVNVASMINKYRR